MAEPTTVQRRGLAKLGLAMPDGSYYIRNGSVGASDLDNAIEAVGRGEPQSSHNAIRVHIMKRAKALGLSDKIPADWDADGSLKHGDELDQQADNFLQHFGIFGMRWGHHLPGVEVLGGPGNGGNGKPAPFIQRGDHTGDKPGDSGPSGQDSNPHEQQAQHALDALKALHDRVSQATEAARTEAENADHAPEQSPSHEQPPMQVRKPAAPVLAKPTKKQATAVHAASKKHQAHVAQIHNKAKAAHAAHKANMAKLAKHPHKAQAKKAAAAASKLHAAHMNHLAKTAHQAHAVHQAHVAKIKKVSSHQDGTSHLTAHDKAALAKLSPTQRSALKKLTPQQRSTLGHMTAAQKAKLSHLTQAEKTALSHLSPAQKSALAKATAASAKKRHDDAVARKAADTSPAAAKKVTAAAEAARTSAQKAAVTKLKTNAQNGSTMRMSMDDPIGTFLEHHGIKGMHWGVRKDRSAHAEELLTKAKAHEEAAVPLIRGAENVKTHLADLGENGTNSDIFKKVYGDRAHTMSSSEFYLRNGQSKAAAVNQTFNDLRMQHNANIRAINRHAAKAKKLREHAAKLQHGDFDEVGEFLEHHGIKGMKWGVRRNGGHPGEAHPASADAQKAHNVAEKIHQHGTASVSNDDLQHLVNRQRLLQQHAQLNPADPSNVRKGLDFVKSVTSDAKTVIDAVDTGRRAVKTFNGLASERPPPRQSRRKRNAPLKVVNIRAA